MTTKVASQKEKLKYRVFPKNKPNQKNFVLEKPNSEQTELVLPEYQVHPSVFEPNSELNAPADQAFNKAIFSWIAPEYHQHPKSKKWWITAGTIVLIALILEAITGSWTFLVATIVAAIFYTYTQIYHPPKHTKIVLSEAGIKIGDLVFPYNKIKDFWIIYQPNEVRKLYFRIYRNYLAEISIELEDQDHLAIREFLLKNLKEEPNKEETFADLLLRVLKI